LIIRTGRLGILDYNLSSESHWVYDKVWNRDDAILIPPTYKDNPFLEPAIMQEIERLEPTPENIKAGKADEVSWKIYGLGVRASPKGLIYPEITVVKTLPPEEDCKKIFYGMDFGFTNDPTAIVKVALAHGSFGFRNLFMKEA
jgi:phage terminase large subunit